MGVCASSNLTPEEQRRQQEERARSKNLEKTLAQDAYTENQVNKLLLLGAGESGKSTLFKQIIEIYGNGFNDAERKTYVHIIHSNIVASMRTLCEQSIRLSSEPHHEPTAVLVENTAKRDTVLDMKTDDPVTPGVAETMIALWRDPGIQQTFALRARFQLMDSAPYFFSQLDVVSKPDYLPSQQDVLRSRVRTTGIVEYEFMMHTNKFKIFDVGGQRNERKKWIHCFSEVMAVIFVAALNEYDMVLFEDETTNRMIEALTLFREICNSPWFKKTSMILFLNKRDLFAEKIKNVPLRVCFPDYDGNNTYEEATAFIQHQFESLNMNKSKSIYTHVTCATDTETMKVIFDSVRDIVIRKSLGEGGLIT